MFRFITVSRASDGAKTESVVVLLSTVFCADDTDVVIRTAGTHDFRAHKLILSLVSSIFGNIFTIPSHSPMLLALHRASTSENPRRHGKTSFESPTPLPHPIVLDGLKFLLFAEKPYELQPSPTPARRVSKT